MTVRFWLNFYRRFTAFNQLVDVCQRIVDSCDDTFVDPEEMSPEWVQLYHDAQAALRAAGVEVPS